MAQKNNPRQYDTAGDNKFEITLILDVFSALNNAVAV